jgi:hypothetical protein
VEEEQVSFLLLGQGLVEQDPVGKPRLKRREVGCCHLLKKTFLKTHDHNITAEYQKSYTRSELFFPKLGATPKY